jgi:cell division protein FtsA
LKERYGGGFEPLVPESDVFELPSTPGQGARNAQRRVLAHIMHMRLQEVLEYALDEITRAGYHQRLPAGVILTGGGALTPGIVELTREAFAMPARCGIPGQRLGSGGQRRITAQRRSPPAGAHGARQVVTSGGFGTGSRKSPAVEKVLAPVKRWLQDFF